MTIPTEQGPFPVPSSEERTWAWVAHAGSILAAWAALAFVAPLLVLLLKGKDSAFVRRHAVESLNFQITTLIYAAISFVLIFVLIGIFLLVALGIFWIVAVVVGTVRAANGEEFRYPLTLRLVH